MTRQERSYLLPDLTAEDRALLAGLPRKATLAGEIDFLRLKLRRMAIDEHTDTRTLLRMLELLTRMVSVQSKLGGGGDHSEIDELKRLVLARAEAEVDND
jgi:hypothetical protein